MKFKQVAALRWKQLFEKARETPINFKVLYDALRNLESTWERDLLSKGEVRTLSSSSNSINGIRHLCKLMTSQKLESVVVVILT